MAILQPKARLHVDHALGPGLHIRLDAERSHYIARVLRLREGEHVGIFNGRDGEWDAILTSVRQPAVEAECVERTRPQRDAPDLWLLFAPLKKSRTDFVVEKATELGVSTIIPVRTELTNARRVAVRRLRLVAREAAEQCHGLTVPEIRDFTELSGLLASWPDDRPLIVCDEMLRDDASPEPDRMDGTGGGWESIEEIAGCSDEEEAKRGLAVLVGPEGGLSPGERESLRGLSRSVTVGLGSRLLRSETAVAAVLTLVNIRGFRR